jgi:ComF family protein
MTDHRQTAPGRLGTLLLNSLFPQHCALCEQRVAGARPLCGDCEGSLRRNDRACVRCALPLAGTGVGVPCPACQAGRFAFDRVRAPWIYDDLLGRLIGRWKYRRDLALTALLADLWLAGAGDFPLPDVLLPVPLHWTRLWQRGFNQADLLARALVAAHPALAPVMLRPRLLRRSRATLPQVGLGARRRGGNAARAFTLRGACDNLSVAVIDDVCTTGATADALARVLCRAGARRVEIWCIARTPAPG